MSLSERLKSIGFTKELTTDDLDAAAAVCEAVEAFQAAEHAIRAVPFLERTYEMTLVRYQTLARLLEVDLG